MVKLMKLRKQNGHRFTIDEIYVNPENVTVIEENVNMIKALQENTANFPEGLLETTRFSTVKTTGGTYTIVGSPDSINEKLQHSKRLLKG